MDGSCKLCGSMIMASTYGFCDECWDRLLTSATHAQANYEQALSDGPHDAMEEQAIFHAYVIEMYQASHGQYVIKDPPLPPVDPPEPEVPCEDICSTCPNEPCRDRQSSYSPDEE